MMHETGIDAVAGRFGVVRTADTPLSDESGIGCPVADHSRPRKNRSETPRADFRLS
jgi:hypothetical protein